MNSVFESYTSKYERFMDVIALSHVYAYKCEPTSGKRHVYQEHKNLPSDSYPFIILISENNQLKLLNSNKTDSSITNQALETAGAIFCPNSLLTWSS